MRRHRSRRRNPYFEEVVTSQTSLEELRTHIHNLRRAKKHLLAAEKLTKGIEDGLWVGIRKMIDGYADKYHTNNINHYLAKVKRYGKKAAWRAK